MTCTRHWSHIDAAAKLNLLYVENHEKHTPLSLAAELCVPEMVKCILNTDAVYKFDMETIGPYKQVMYKFAQQDILLNVMRQLTDVPERKLSRFTDTNVLGDAPLRETRKKLKQKHF